MTVVSNIGQEVDLEMSQGADFSFQLIVSQANNTPQPLVGAAVYAEIKESNETSIVQCSFTCSGTGADGTVVTFGTGLLNGTPAIGDSVAGVTSAATGTVVGFNPVTQVLTLGSVTGTFQVAEQIDDLTQTFTTTAEIASFAATTLFNTDGVVNLTLLAANNTLAPGANLTDPEGQYVWDMKIVLASGATLRPYFGNVSVVAAVTQ